MPRTMTAIALVLTAFGVGYGARTAIELRQAGGTPVQGLQPVPAVSEVAPVTPDGLDSRPDPLFGAYPVAQNTPALPLPPALIPAKPASMTGQAMGESTPAQSAPVTSSVALAYAPAVPAVPDPFAVLSSLRKASAAEPVPAPDLMPFSPADELATRDAISSYQKGDIAAGDATARRISDPSAKLLAEWVLVRSGNRAVSHQRIRAFASANPQWPTQSLLARRAEEALIADVKSPGLIRSFFGTRGAVTAGGKIAMARALASEGKKDEAHAQLRAIWRTEHFSDQIEDALLKEFPGVISREDHRARMERYNFKSMWTKALRAAAWAGPEYGALVKARQAVENGSAAAKKLVAAIPASLTNDTSAVFARAQLARRNNDAAAAAKMIENVSRDPAILVDGDEWWIERRLIARKLLDAGDFENAYKVAAGHGAASPSMKVEADFHAGWIALRFLSDPKKAEQHFLAVQAAARTPMSQSRAAYWLARTARQEGDLLKARTLFETASQHSAFFYGQLARSEIGIVDLPTHAPELTPEERKAIANDGTLRAIDLLLSMGDRDLALQMTVDMAQNSGTVLQLQALGLIYAARQDSRAQLVLGKLALQRGVPLKYHAFPTRGIPEFQALNAPVETPIVHAIARQESAFNPRAVSHAGAMGLMQLMPATARVTATRAKAPYDADRLLSDPAYNAQIGAAHLSELVESWRGSYILTFAAYNAGAGNVKKWIEANGDPRQPSVDPIDWIERIPFTETRNYVQRIMENLQVYRARFTPGAPLRIETDLRRGARNDLAQGL